MYESVVTADWHMEALERFFKTDAIARAVALIDKPFLHAATNGIEYVDILGDLTDKPSLPESYLIALITFLLKYDGAVNSTYITGNHDWAHVGKSSAQVLHCLVQNGFFKSFKIYDAPKIVKKRGVNVAYVPYPFNEVPECDGPRLIMAHIEEDGALGDNGRPLREVGAKHRIIRRDNDVVVSGHLHTHQWLPKKRTLFVGNLYQKNFGEALPKGFCTIKAKTKDDRLLFKFEQHDSHPEFTLRNLLIESRDDWDTVISSQNDFFKVTLADGVVLPKNALKEMPNIVSVNGQRTLARIETLGSKSVKDMPKITPLTGLVRYLQEAKLEDKDVKKAIRLVKEAIAYLKNTGQENQDG